MNDGEYIPDGNITITNNKAILFTSRPKIFLALVGSAFVLGVAFGKAS